MQCLMLVGTSKMTLKGWSGFVLYHTQPVTCAAVVGQGGVRRRSLVVMIRICFSGSAMDEVS